MRHIVGKTYFLTQESMNKLILELEELQRENARLREALEFIYDHIGYDMLADETQEIIDVAWKALTLGPKE